MADSLSIVIPARNEEASIIDTLSRVRTILGNTFVHDPIPCQLLVVNDHSADSTASVARRYAETIENVDPPGYGYAIRTGLRRVSGTYVTIMTADGSDSPDDLLAMWEQRSPYRLVVGERWEHGTTEGYPYLKSWVNFLGNAWLAHRTGTTYDDWTNPFKLYPTDVVRAVLPSCTAPDQSAGMELALRCWQAGRRTAKLDLTIVPHHWVERRAGRSKFHLLRDSFRYYHTARRVLGDPHV